jgi:signal transduction histidine kinase
VHPEPLTAAVLIAFSVVNVEMARALASDLERSHQPRRALSGWALASALLLPAPWLLLIVPITYAHARWRGAEMKLWKWVGSGAFVVLSGVAAGAVAHATFGESAHWTLGDGGRGLVAVVAAAATFLLVETVLFSARAWLNHAVDEVFLRENLRGKSLYLTETGVLLMGGLLSAVWVGGAWFVLLFLPIYVLAQRAVLYQPMRERAEAAARLTIANEHLERANAFKADLMGMLGHELGNPLTSITGYAQVATEELDAEDYAAAKRSLYVVERNADRLRTVLYEILTHAASDQDALVAHPEQCLVEPHLSAAAAAFPHGHRPHVDCADGLSAWVQPGHLDQMLANLVSNAHKYAGGAVRLSASPVHGQLLICVTDDGPGVPERFRERLFDRYARDSHTANHTAGTGLGLFITRQLARANGGDLTYEAAGPTGSAFTLTLPQPPSP